MTSSAKSFVECIDMSSDESLSSETSHCDFGVICESSETIVNNWWEEYQTLFDCPKLNPFNVWQVFTEPQPQTHYTLGVDQVRQLPAHLWTPIPREDGLSLEIPIPEENIAVKCEQSSVDRDFKSHFDCEDEKDLRNRFEALLDLRCEEKGHPYEDMNGNEYLNQELKIFEYKTNEYSPWNDLSQGWEDIRDMRIKKRKDMTPMADNILEFIVKGRDSVKAKEILFSHKAFGVVYWKPKWIGWLSPLWAYYYIIGKQEVRERVLEAMESEGITIEILPQEYCSLCYNSSHSRENCSGCSECLSNEHQYRQCRHWTGGEAPKRKSDNEVHRETLKRRRIREQLNTPGHRYWKSGPLYDKPIGQGDATDDWKEAAIAVEKGMSANGLVPIKVVVNVWYEKIGSQNRFFADINTSKDVINLMDKYSGVNASDVRRGIVLKYIRQRVLQICCGKTLYCFDARNDFECLGITASDVFDHSIHVIDIQKIPRHMKGNHKISLKDMYFAYFNTKIQEYDFKPRPMGRHNIEIAGRSTLKIAVKYRKLLKKAINGLVDNKSLRPGVTIPMNYYEIRDIIKMSKMRGVLPLITFKSFNN